MDTQQAAVARANIDKIIEQLNAMKLRPWSFHKLLGLIRAVTVGLLRMTAELLVANGNLADSLGNCAVIDVQFEEKFKKLWEEVYKGEEERRKMAAKIEYLEGELAKRKGGPA